MIKLIWDYETFQTKGFDGEIAKYMRENKNTAIVHGIGIVSYKSWKEFYNFYNLDDEKRLSHLQKQKK